MSIDTRYYTQAASYRIRKQDACITLSYTAGAESNQAILSYYAAIVLMVLKTRTSSKA
ncbi:MAG: hypothetical protein AABX51_05515 [Nanoarchaeota archaeon]